MKYLTDQFELCFCFCIGSTKQLYFIFVMATQLASVQTTCQLLYALSCLCIPVSNAVVNEQSVMSLLFSRCGKVVILNLFKTDINVVLFFPVFQMCSWCFQEHSGDSGTQAPRTQPESSITIYISERELACYVYLCHHPRSHFNKLLTRNMLFGPCHCSYIFVPCLAFHVHVAGDLDKTISFVVDVLQSRRHGGSLVGLAHQTNFKLSQIEV